MTLAYVLTLTPDDNGALLVTAEDLPEVTTYAEPEDEAVQQAARAAIEEALAARIAFDQPIPHPSATHGVAVKLPLLTELKTMLHMAVRGQNLSRAELARRLGWHREQVDRLFRLDHASRLDQIEAAFKVLGQELKVEAAAA